VHFVLIVSNPLHVSRYSSCLLSSQHLAYESNANSPKQRGTCCAAYEDDLHIVGNKNGKARGSNLIESLVMWYCNMVHNLGISGIQGILLGI
jgi:hypothetical protein